MFLARSWKSICACAAICGLLYAGWVWLKVPLYPASVTTILPAYSRLSPQGFQRLLESDAVVGKTLTELRSQGICQPNETLTAGDDLRTTLQAAPPGTTGQASTLDATVLHPDRDKAAAIANTWGTVFVQAAREVAVAKSASLAAWDDKTQAIKAAWAKLESERSRLNGQLAKQESDLRAQFDKQLGEHYLATADVLGQHLRETAKLLKDKDAEHRNALAELRRKQPSIAERKSLLKTLRNLVDRLREEQVSIAADLPGKLKQIETLTQELARVPQLLTVRRSAAEEPGSRSPSGGGEKPPAGTLVSDAINPLYNELSAQLVKLKMDAEALSLRAKRVEQDLKSLQDQAATVETATQADEAAVASVEHAQRLAVETLENERAFGLKALERQRKLGESQIRAQEEDGVESLRRGSAAQIEQSTRGMKEQADLLAQVSKAINQDRTQAIQQAGGEVEIASPASAALQPLPRVSTTRAIMALFLGGALGAFLSLMRRLTSSAENSRPPQAPNGTGK
ncbi:MAG: hypothetical protein NTW87_24010 [Planctomycetota bacterium]|nr:hypothetical protein [Planctomycetota bacterium]